MTQVSRLVQYLRDHPMASGLEIVQALAMPKYTSRISDARAAGHTIDCVRRRDGRQGYVLRTAQRVTTGIQDGLALS